MEVSDSKLKSGFGFLDLYVFPRTSTLDDHWAMADGQ
jgi:hypothetical protein